MPTTRFSLTATSWTDLGATPLLVECISSNRAILTALSSSPASIDDPGFPVGYTDENGMTFDVPGFHVYGKAETGEATVDASTVAAAAGSLLPASLGQKPRTGSLAVALSIEDAAAVESLLTAIEALSGVGGGGTAAAVVATSTPADIPYSTVSSLLLAANPSRLSSVGHNRCDVECFIKEGAGAAIIGGGYTYRVGAGENWVMANPVYRGILHIIWPSGGTGSFNVADRS